MKINIINIYKLLFLLSLSYINLVALSTSPYYKNNMYVFKEFDVSPEVLRDKNFRDTLSFYRALYTKDGSFINNNKYSKIFIPTIKDMLYKAGIPQDMLYLVMAESLFKSRAKSNKHAIGLWQFMNGTAKDYGLKVNQYVDERRDIIKSTNAAIKYLKKLHKRFGKWYLVVIAYNSGPNRLSKAIKKAGSDDLTVLVNDYVRYIPNESKNHIAKIIVLATLSHDSEFLQKNHITFLQNRGTTNSLATVKVGRGESLTRVAKILNIDRDLLVSLNLQLRYDFIPYKYESYNIYVPYNKLADFELNYKPVDPNKLYFIHIVEKGDSLISIGRRYGVNYKLIRSYNHIGKHQILKLKQKVYIPSRVKGSELKPKTHHKNHHTYYKVKNGDSLIRIAKKFNISVGKLVAMNNFSKNKIIYVGEKIVIHK